MYPAGELAVLPQLLLHFAKRKKEADLLTLRKFMGQQMQTKYFLCLAWLIILAVLI